MAHPGGSGGGTAERDPADPLDPSDRRATACCVVFADMVGYSALSSTHELATHLMWMDFRRTCLDPEVERHGGAVIRLLGDGCLITFEDADAALAWMLDVRGRIVADRIGASARWQSLSLRFGAHHCEVIREKDDIYGAGVNLAKRIQERALGDGVLVSDAFLARLARDPPVPFRYLGELELPQHRPSRWRPTRRSFAERTARRCARPATTCPRSPSCRS